MIEIHDKKFKSIAAAKKFFRALIDGKLNALPITEHDMFMQPDETFAYLKALVLRHPADEMRLDGIKSFSIRLKHCQPGENIKTHIATYVRYEDGEERIFSGINKCIEAKEDPEKILKNKYRDAINDTIIAFRTRHTSDPCDYEGHIGPVEQGEQVDHEPPNTFQSLLDSFRLKVGVLDPTPEQLSEWKKYHDSNCKLRWVCKLCNTSGIKKEYNITKKLDRYTEYDQYLEKLK